MSSFNFHGGDFCQSEMGAYADQEDQDIRAEMQAITDPGLNNVLLGLSDALDTIPRSRYVGLTLGDLPLTNMNGSGSENFNANRAMSDQQNMANHDHPPDGLSFPVDASHRQGENDNHLAMQEIRMIHQSELENEQQQEREQQHHQHHQHHQLMTENGPTDAFHEQSSETKNCPGYSYDQKSGGHGFMTAWEESVKYMEDLRQLQELQAQQQPRAQPIANRVQPNNDIFSLENLGGLSAGIQAFNSFSELEKISEGHDLKDKLPAEVFNLLQQPSHSISPSCSTGLAFASSSGSVYPSVSNFKRPTGPVNSCHVHVPMPNPHGYQLMDRGTNSSLFGGNGIQAPAVAYPGPFTKLLNYNNVPGGSSRNYSKIFNYNSPAASGPGFFPTDLPPTKSGSNVDLLQLEYGHNEELQDVFGAAQMTAPSHFLPEIPRRTKSASGRLTNEAEQKPLHHFATERQRREHLNEKYQTLRSLVPNPTKADRASIVSDAINRIHDLKKEEEGLMDEKKNRQLRRQLRLEMRANGKRQRAEESETAVKEDGESLCLKALWSKKVSKHGTEIEVRIVCDEVDIHIRQKHMPRFLIRVITAVERGLKLEILDGTGGVIHNCDVYRFKLKIQGDSCAFMGVIMAKLLEILDTVF
ncbi:hypothetical protein AXG93_2752s2030 [Marchantia polymorpha subsp. ruderalis]|uniref:BHLH domain-containing protein n=2 Tax=Marchantia polymorpha TaxID=3197 RepID=A0A176VTW6_MARPO|nr:hypothetical protein AXG93_2752s2030 [Marchantia polymorpha subsp. ruderalis]